MNNAQGNILRPIKRPQLYTVALAYVKVSISRSHRKVVEKKLKQK